jgi:hypothetical protein
MVVKGMPGVKHVLPLQVALCPEGWHVYQLRTGALVDGLARLSC